MIGSNHDKTGKGSENFIPWRRHHPRLHVAVQKPNSPCRHEVVDVTAATFTGTAMERPNPPYLLAVAGKEEEETDPQYQNNWYEETLTLKNSI